MSVTIYHNPRCSKSRETLQLISDSGAEHDIRLYLVDTPDAPTILDLAAKLGCSVADIVRRGERVFKEAEDLPKLDDDQALAEWVASNPITLERPIVVDKASGQAIIGRPPENVLTLVS